ncbi:hypothetical protein STENM327S_09092 [Streptomyces tendae]
MLGAPERGAGRDDMRLSRAGATSHDRPAAATMPRSPAPQAPTRSALRNNTAATTPPSNTATAPTD